MTQHFNKSVEPPINLTNYANKRNTAMGFSLQMFFDELTALLEAPGLDDSQRLALLEKKVKDERQYAKDCNMIDKD